MRDLHVGGKIGAILALAFLAMGAWYLKSLERTAAFDAARNAYVQAHPEAVGARFAICYLCGYRSRSFADQKELRFGIRVSLADGTDTAIAEVSTTAGQEPTVTLH
jgi:hypothetical protein